MNERTVPIFPPAPLGAPHTGAGARPQVRSSDAAGPRCLRCQLIGQRGLLCTGATGACGNGARLHPLGPILLLAWSGTLAAFVLAVS